MPELGGTLEVGIGDVAPTLRSARTGLKPGATAKEDQDDGKRMKR